MAIIKIDDKEYDTDALSDEAKAQLISLQFCDTELQRLQAEAAAVQTARMAYARALKEALDKPATSDQSEKNKSAGNGKAQEQDGAEKKKGVFGGLFGKKG